MDVPLGEQRQSSKTTPKRRGRNKGMCLEDRPVLEPNAAGIDVGAREMFVAVPPGRDKNPVRVFSTFTEELEHLADYADTLPHHVDDGDDQSKERPEEDDNVPRSPFGEQQRSVQPDDQD